MNRGALRTGFLMEQVLGHVSHYRTLRAVLDSEPSIEPHWVEVTYAGQGRLERLPGLPESATGTLRGFLQVRDGLRHHKLDALFFHTQKPAVFQWDHMLRTPTVLSLDVTPRQYDELGVFYDHAADRDNAVARVKHWINCRTFALARSIVVWSNWVRDSLVNDYKVPPDKVRVIPPGVDMSLWTPPARKQNALPRVLFVGGDFDRKGGPLLLDWFRTSGRGRCALDIVTRADIPAEEGVTVHRGIVGNSPESRALFYNADIFTLPSLGECFGIASVEAMAAGLPVVATNVGGAADIVDDGRTGFLIEAHDQARLSNSLNRLLDDATLRTTMGQRGRRKAEHVFDGVANARAVMRCLHEAAAWSPSLSQVERAPRRMPHGS